jgi:hypothetical protein
MQLKKAEPKPVEKPVEPPVVIEPFPSPPAEEAVPRKAEGIFFSKSNVQGLLSNSILFSSFV